MEELSMNPLEIPCDNFLDARGLTCPIPLLKAKQEIAQMHSGEILELWGTDPKTKNELSVYCKRNNTEFLGYIDTEDGYTKYYIKITWVKN